MYQIILIFHVLAAIFLIALVLLQQGKGATIGAAFGSGASQTVFGSRGSGSFLMRLTIGIVIVFFSTSIALNYLASHVVKQQDQGLVLPMQSQESVPLPLTPSNVTPNSIPVNTPEQPVEKEKS